MAGASTGEQQAPPPPPHATATATATTRARSPAPALLCTPAAARASVGGTATGHAQPQHKPPAPFPPSSSSSSSSSSGRHQLLLAGAVLQRQYLGQPLPTALSSFYLPPSLGRALPHDHLVLTFASHTAAGRLDYNYSSPGADPLLAVVSASGNFGLSLWRHPLAPGGRPAKLLCLPHLHTAPPSSLRWSPLPSQPSEVITTSEDGTCKVTDIAQRATVASLTCPAPPFAATPIDAATLAVGFGRRVGLWDRRAPTLQQGQGQQGLPQAGGLVTDMAAAVGAPLLLSSSVDGTVKAWDLRRGLDQAVATLRFQTEDMGVTSLQLHTGNTRLLVSCEGPTTYDVSLARLFERTDWLVHNNDQLTGLPFCPLLHRAYEQGGANRLNLKRAQLSEDGRYMVRGSDDGRCYLWDAHRGCLLRRFDGARAAPVLGHAATHPGALLSAAISRTAPFPQLAFASDLAAFLYSYVEAPNGGPYAADGIFLPDVELMDDSLAEEAGAEERGGMWMGEEGVMDEEEEEQAWERDRLGLRDGECSYGRGYVTQLVFVCETCHEQARARTGAASAAAAAGSEGDGGEEEPLLHGVCVSCAHQCHGILGHTLRNIGEKKGFRCDCGNARFAHAGRWGGLTCTLQREREAINTGNQYGHNFEDKWCYCDGPEVLPMVQCLHCKDWFHQMGGCIHTDFDFTRDDFAEGEDYICETCLDDQPDLAFLLSYPPKPLADRPAWDPHAPQTPATPASGLLSLTSPSPSTAASASAATTPGTMRAAAASPAASAAASAMEEEEEEDATGERCVACDRPRVPGAPACLSSLVACTGRVPQGQGEGDRKPSAAEMEKEEAGVGACGRLYHPACLPRGAAGVRDADGEWCCPACVTGATAIHQCAQVDPSLPPLAWRMQRGLFLPPGWEALLASEEHKALARRALGEDVPTAARASGATPQRPASSSSSRIRTSTSTTAAATAAAAPTMPLPAPGSAARQQPQQPSLPEAPPSPDAYVNRLLECPQSEEEANAEIRRAAAAGDEARAFRLVMQRILAQVATQTQETRRSVILPSDIERAAAAVRFGRLGDNGGGGGGGGQGQQGQGRQG